MLLYVFFKQLLSWFCLFKYSGKQEIGMFEQARDSCRVRDQSQHPVQTFIDEGSLVQLIRVHCIFVLILVTEAKVVSINPRNFKYVNLAEFLITQLPYKEDNMRLPGPRW